MNNLMVTVMDKDTFVKREMGEFEIRGAMLSIYQLAREYEKDEYGDTSITMDMINDDCYYANKKLEFTSRYSFRTYNGRLVNLDSMFCVENSIDNIFAYVYDFDDEEETLFLVRIS